MSTDGDRFQKLNLYGLYGANVVAAEYCGLHEPPAPALGTWQHGWMPSYRKPIHPDMVMGTPTDEYPQKPYWVARADEESYLRGQGLKAKAIGLPIVYVSDETVTRIPKSLLVMPAHSLDFTTHAWKFEEYASEIHSLRGSFSDITVCVHPSCWRNGYWVGAFNKLGFKVIKGASVDDFDSLKNMRQLLSRFEYVTTNGFGSHIAYAAYFGAKVSVYGQYAVLKAEDYRNAPLYQQNLAILEPALNSVSQQVVMKNYPELFCHPLEAQQKIDWARHEVGHQHKVAPAELRKLFGWNKSAMSIHKVRSVRSTIQNAIPGRLQHLCKMLLRSSYRQRYREFERLSQAPSHTPVTTTLLGKPLELVDGPSFRFYHTEIFERQLYRFSSAEEAPRIIDAGANVGLSVIYFKQLFPNSRIIAFEPDPNVYQVLRRNCESFSLPDVSLEQKALWTCDTILTFQGEGGDAGRISAESPSETSFEVPTCRLRDYLHDRVHFLKIDIEGAETDVLVDCADLLHNVDKLFVEYHSFLKKEQSLDVLLRLLREAGFRVNVEACNPSLQPFIYRNVNLGMDLQLNIFAVRE